MIINYITIWLQTRWRSCLVSPVLVWYQKHLPLISSIFIPVLMQSCSPTVFSSYPGAIFNQFGVPSQQLIVVCLCVKISSQHTRVWLWQSQFLCTPARSNRRRLSILVIECRTSKLIHILYSFYSYKSLLIR